MSEIFAKAAQPGVVREFSIHGLYGYRSLHLRAHHSASILIARNGMGKTTLLAALNVFLKRQFHRLAEIDFQHIECNLQGSLIHLWKFEVEPLRAFMAGPSFSQLVESTKVPGPELLDFLLGEYDSSQAAISIHESEIGEKLLQTFRWEVALAKAAFDRIFKELAELAPEVLGARERIRSVLGETEIVYLPTYRRIELPLAERKSDEYVSFRKRRNPAKSLGFYQGGLHSPDINFGLSDISERLSALNMQIQSTSNNGYRAISANIIKELLDGSFERSQYSPGALPDKSSLKLFFDRLQLPNSRVFRGSGDIVVPDLDRIYSEGANTPYGRMFLSYFLSKLAAVIDTTRDVEVMVENFVEHCNAYLSGWLDRDHEQLFNVGSGEIDPIDFDAKSLVLDRQNLAVQVVRTITGQPVPLDALSSGEKQIISLFARLYLYERDMIVLIDEPELSLSLEWQQKILPDVMAAPKCVQMVAITHSPFVFENELDPFAGPLIAESIFHPHAEAGAAHE